MLLSLRKLKIIFLLIFKIPGWFLEIKTLPRVWQACGQPNCLFLIELVKIYRTHSNTHFRKGLNHSTLFTGTVMQYGFW